MKKINLNLANFITFSRIMSSITLVFISIFTFPYYFLYTYSGISDMIDGYIARKLKTTSKIGEKLDTMADIIFFLSVIFIIIKNFTFAKNTWLFLIASVIVKIFNILHNLKINKSNIFPHSRLSKILGLILFLLFYFIKFININLIIIIASVIAIVFNLLEIIKTYSDYIQTENSINKK